MDVIRALEAILVELQYFILNNIWSDTVRKPYYYAANQSVLC